MPQTLETEMMTLKGMNLMLTNCWNYVVQELLMEYIYIILYYLLLQLLAVAEMYREIAHTFIKLCQPFPGGIFLLLLLLMEINYTN